MNFKGATSKIWNYLKKDTWDSWLVSIILIFLVIKFVFFPLLSLTTGSSLPLVVVESCSLYHDTNFDDWWDSNGQWYESNNITKEEFENYQFSNGMNKGDIILVIKKSEYKKGEIIIFNPEVQTRNPIIHRVVTTNPLSTKGDHNSDQLSIEKQISEEQIIGKAVLKIPLLGWIKLVFFEPFKPKSERGLCG
ncbi:MAG: S26 family signal peptidase [Candidatus Pacearchaeota archaeon]